ncbi:hypothetical protein NEOLEDRAFT_1035141, partial [Neolentinus lepideus HHB14362 ss-1]
MSDCARRNLTAYHRSRRYTVLDKDSIIAKDFFSQLERNCSSARAGAGIATDEPFGGLNVILCGDFHQFPPVSRKASSALYYPNHVANTDTEDDRSGRLLYEAFNIVMLLKEQVRVTDPVWLDFLWHLRRGQVRDHHIEMLRRLIITHPECPPTNFGIEPWSTAALVTPRHAVREAWNQAAVEKHCRNMQRQLFICPAEDSANRRPLNMNEQFAVASYIHKCRKNGRRLLPDEVPLTVGMKVMVTLNLATDLDIANGARGEITRIVLDPEEPPVAD